MYTVLSEETGWHGMVGIMLMSHLIMSFIFFLKAPVPSCLTKHGTG